MKRIARCALAALLAAVFASPVLAAPPPVLAPVASLTAQASPIPDPTPTPWPVAQSTGEPWLTTVVVPAATPTPAPIPTVQDAKDYALEQLGSAQYACLDGIAFYESKWNPHVYNAKGSGAYGIPQAKPGSKMASAGNDWLDNPVTQVRWMIAYVTRKYGSACNAAAFRAKHGWY